MQKEFHCRGRFWAVSKSICVLVFFSRFPLKSIMWRKLDIDPALAWRHSVAAGTRFKVTRTSGSVQGDKKWIQTWDGYIQFETQPVSELTNKHNIVTFNSIHTRVLRSILPSYALNVKNLHDPPRRIVVLEKQFISASPLSAKLNLVSNTSFSEPYWLHAGSREFQGQIKQLYIWELVNASRNFHVFC